MESESFSVSRWILLAIGAVACTGILSGCTDDSFSAAAGHYEGFAIARNTNAPTQESISADVQSVSNDDLKIAIKTEPATTEIDLELKISGNQIELSSPSGYFPKSLELQSSAQNCFAGSGSQLCFDGNELKLLLAVDSRNTKLILDRMASSDPSPIPSMETSRTYTIDELMQRAEDRSFTSQVEFESLVQAKLTAQTAYLDLLPHINVGSALTLVGFVTLTMVRAIGDLVPFVLPNRWFQAAALDDAADAEFDAYRIVQASSMNVVQGLALSVLRDEQALYMLEQNRVQITQVRDEVLESEQNGGGIVQIGTSDDITSELITLIKSIDSMKETIHEEKTALSQGTGFNNPSAVSGVSPVAVPAIQGPLPGSPQDYENSAVARSLQLLQMDALIEGARNTRDAKYWQWLDTAGDDQGSLGFGTVDYIQVGSAMVDQLYAKKKQAQSSLKTMVTNALSQSQEISDDYQLALQESKTAQNRIDRLLMDFRTGIPFAMSDLVSALHGKAQGDIDQVNAQYAYMILQAQMDFLTFSGPYVVLLGEKAQTP